MYYKRKAYQKLLNGSSSIPGNMLFYLKEPGESENQRLQKTLPKVNTDHIY